MTPGGIVDCHAHWVPPALARALRERAGARRVPFVEPEAGSGREWLRMPIGSLRFGDEHVEVDRRLAFMDAHGVARQLLSLPGLFGVDSLPIDEARPLVRGFNDDCAALCRTRADRFRGLAALPLADVGEAVAELERASALGLRGAILPVDAFASEATAARLAPIFQAGDRLGSHFFIHPGRMPGVSGEPELPPDQDLARRALAVQHEVGQAMVTLLLTDLLAPYEHMTVHVANLGGTFPAVVERMDEMTRLRDPAAPRPSSRARRVWVDTASLGPRAIEQAAAVFGSDRLLLGTDCPIFDTAATVAAIAQARISDDARRQIAAENAQRLLGER